ncbi:MULTISPECIES: flagellar biosynthesis protein FlhF [Bacillaceae]|uniref:Flagellar biosynthesis protein FlhF n=1 Tax=Evansella alkalicola TaxID=745819 RepID=A0ABS6JPZ5_9BACI|nr:flagellar biosynthesis protein FlhF [Litchfieldia alkalitelluris]MBU9720337.1 flagellar biosynthesis protein FlhF [Bacillus alkalicola]
MKVKKITANSMPEAMTKVKEELGNDAVILNTKKVETGGFLGLFTKKKIEVIAAIDPKSRPRVIEKKMTKVNKTAKTDAAQVRKETKLTSEIAEIKDMIKGMNGQQQRISADHFPGHLNDLNKLLSNQGLGLDHQAQIMNNLLKRWYTENGDEKGIDTLHEWLKEEIRHYINGFKANPFTYDKKFINLVGPTGVGKTTTIAKIAAKAALIDKKSVAFITTDTFRIAAINQLKTYGEILNAPVEVAYSIEDFHHAKEKLKNYDFILVDSAGRNFRNPLYVEQLKKVIDFNHEMETHLVLSLTSKYSDMKRIIEQFQLININKVIFTKSDETDSYGAMINVFKDYEINCSYITNGQNVPDDIQEPTVDMLVNYIAGDMNNA